MRTKGALSYRAAQIPCAAQVPQEIKESRDKLPIFEYSERIIKTLQENRVVIVSGPTGAGKTTQVRIYQFLAASEAKLLELHS